MAGTFSAACAMGRLSLARERGRVRVDSKTPLIVPTLHLHPLPLSQGESRKSTQAPNSEKRYAAKSSPLAIPNILWVAGSKNPSNCVFFACNPPTLAVMTS